MKDKRLNVVVCNQVLLTIERLRSWYSSVLRKMYTITFYRTDARKNKGFSQRFKCLTIVAQILATHGQRSHYIFSLRLGRFQIQVKVFANSAMIDRSPYITI